LSAETSSTRPLCGYGLGRHGFAVSRLKSAMPFNRQGEGGKNRIRRVLCLPLAAVIVRLEVARPECSHQVTIVMTRWCPDPHDWRQD